MINLILHSNLFNFAVFLLIIIVIAKKVDISAILERMRSNVTEKLDESARVQQGALENLEKAKESTSKTQSEIDEIINNAQKTSQTMKSQIITDANEKVNAIAKNSKNILQSEENHTTTSLISRLGIKSVEIAQYEIINELNKNPDLHNKFIDESIKDLERAEL